MNEIPLRRWGGREQSSNFFPPYACVHRLNTPLHRGLTSGQCPVQAGERGPTSVFPVHLKTQCLTLSFPYSVSLSIPKGIAAARKLNPWSHPSPKESSNSPSSKLKYSADALWPRAVVIPATGKEGLQHYTAAQPPVWPVPNLTLPLPNQD